MSNPTIRLLLIAISILGSQAKTVTYPGIGTFNSHDFYDINHRPFTDLYTPQSPAHMELIFDLYTRANPTTGERLHWNSTDDIVKSKFYNGSLPTKMFIHGFSDAEKPNDYLHAFKDHYLEYESVNMIIVDWHKGAENPYGQATVNTRVVGPMVAIQAEELIRLKGGNLDQFHLLGHSLGAHVAGNAGKFLQGKLGRITGLDPAGPYFEHLVPEARLWHTDARFVDSIHTDSRILLDKLGLGMMETCSHVDVYPNGGRDQPGCDEERAEFFLQDFATAMRTLTGCSHHRAIQFYQDTLAHKEEVPKAYQCDSYAHFRDGLCTDCGKDGEKCVIIGPKAADFFAVHSKTLEHGKRFFIATDYHEPFFQWNYLVKIKIAEKGKDHHEERGKLFLKLQDATGFSQEVQFGPEKTFHLNQTLGEVVVASVDPSEMINSVEMRWDHGALNVFNSKLYIDSIEIVGLSSHTSTMTSVPEVRRYCNSEVQLHGVENTKHVSFGKC